jgi:hypothetical protein
VAFRSVTGSRSAPDRRQPTVAIGGLTELDGREGLTQAQGIGARLTVADLDPFPGDGDRPHRCNDGRRTRQEGLTVFGPGPELVERDLALLDGVTEVGGQGQGGA